MFRIPNLEKLDGSKRAEVANGLRQRAAELEAQAEAAESQVAILTATANKAAGQAYHLRRMAHAVEMFTDEPEPT